MYEFIRSIHVQFRPAQSVKPVLGFYQFSPQFFSIGLLNFFFHVC